MHVWELDGCDLDTVSQWVTCLCELTVCHCRMLSLLVPSQKWRKCIKVNCNMWESSARDSCVTKLNEQGMTSLELWKSRLRYSLLVHPFFWCWAFNDYTAKNRYEQLLTLPILQDSNVLVVASDVFSDHSAFIIWVDQPKKSGTVRLQN